MRPIENFIDPSVTDFDAIAKLQQTLNAGELKLNGVLVDRFEGFARLNNVAQAVFLGSSGDLSTINFEIFGKDENGRDVSETIAGPNAGVVNTTGLFVTVSKITADSAVTSSVEAGITASVAPFTTFPVLLNWRPAYKGTKITQSVEVSAGASLTYSVQFTVSNIQDPSVVPVWQDTDNVNLIDETTTNTGNIFFPVRATRLNITTYTSGTLNFINIQDS